MKKRSFGKLPDGREADLFTLSSPSGITVEITNYGGRIVSIRTPDRGGKPDEINMGFPTLSGYVDYRHYAGALVGRVANRIRNGRFSLAGKDYQLWLNPKGVHLHGGEFGFSFKLWKAWDDGGRLALEYLSPDGEEHYPGRLTTRVRYSLSGSDLEISYEAKTDQTTIVNLTNHAFFNLNGFKRDVNAHELRIQADACSVVDAELLVPTGEIAKVAGTPLDFNIAKPIGRDIGALPGGYDHNYIFRPAKPGEWLAEVYDPDSGRTLAMATDQPCTQFYGGNNLDGSLTGLEGAVYKKHYAFCLEAQIHPDAVNHPHFASCVLEPGEVYRQTTVYRFGVR
ncbi:MAG: galactose mutarotase [Planctomycetes bacterium]|nr:galactose mutarotase [Planctomycetota bacterium]